MAKRRGGGSSEGDGGGGETERGKFNGRHIRNARFVDINLDKMHSSLLVLQVHVSYCTWGLYPECSFMYSGTQGTNPMYSRNPWYSAIVHH